jgi:DNA-binding PadR family transcriptional regulator
LKISKTGRWRRGAGLDSRYFFWSIEEMPRSLGELDLLILLALIRLGPESYGVPLTREIEARGRRSVALGSVYAALDRMEEAGLVKSRLGEATPERGGRAKRYFQITAKGLREAQAARRTLVNMWKGLPQLEGGRP